jgi:hypothetical protein
VWQNFVKPPASSKMDVENQLSHAYIVVERMLTGETALEDFVSSGEIKACFRPDVENAIIATPWAKLPGEFAIPFPLCAQKLPWLSTGSGPLL